jgi:hypothetical protein
VQQVDALSPDGNAGLLGTFSCEHEADFGYVGYGHLKTAMCEPNRVSSRSAGDV